MEEPIAAQKFPIVQKVEPGITEARTVAWCACKHSGTTPFCDGTHSTLE
jgi:CDGSH-type Zn-finger protein